MGAPALKFDVDFIKPFIEGSVETLKVQCGKAVTVEKPFSRKEDTALQAVDIAGIIGVVSSAFTGSIILSFPKETFLNIMSCMLGEEFTEIDKDLEDGAGELLNIIFGYAKRVLNNQGYDLNKAIPSVIRGDSLSVNHFSDRPSIICPFKFDGKQFYIEICINN